jgi:hypothetical protein
MMPGLREENALKQKDRASAWILIEPKGKSGSEIDGACCAAGQAARAPGLV